MSGESVLVRLERLFVISVLLHLVGVHRFKLDVYFLFVPKKRGWVLVHFLHHHHKFLILATFSRVELKILFIFFTFFTKDFFAQT